MIRDFDRLTLSVHYASSTPEKKYGHGHGHGNSNGNGKANSVEENSVNSEDYEVGAQEHLALAPLGITTLKRVDMVNGTSPMKAKENSTYGY